MKSSERSFARRIDLTSLQLFVAVCELGSIGRAAEREFIAASAVSKRLSDLETAVDTALLYRHSRGVTLTPAGESLLHHARTVLFGLERMQGELSEYADGVRGHVRMHANISAIFQFLPEDLGAFAREMGAYRLAGMTPEQRLEVALQQGSILHPASYRKEFSNGASVAWSRVPWTLGCCARWTEESRKEHYQTLVTMDRRIVLAGEHASYVGCWMEGALLSSIDAISQLHKRALEA